ncbi:hypothetical protein CDAR_490941 [Caerostris darwini]|uniref:Uncharacterized protein n=1 Tax=Caerostris darwini TaxID=1538125 RepID=A0AAV4X6P4_9ARAC|nr:hypothetical protein CDAR_490941 [Caerostris darwini]
MPYLSFNSGSQWRDSTQPGKQAETPVERLELFLTNFSLRIESRIVKVGRFLLCQNRKKGKRSYFFCVCLFVRFFFTFFFHPVDRWKIVRFLDCCEYTTAAWLLLVPPQTIVDDVRLVFVFGLVSEWKFFFSPTLLFGLFRKEKALSESFFICGYLAATLNFAACMHNVQTFEFIQCLFLFLNYRMCSFKQCS